MTHKNEIRELDRIISSRLNSELPQAPENEWFTRRVVNRLPDKRHNRVASAIKWFCYLLSIAGLGCGAWFTVASVLENGITLGSLLFLSLFPILAVFCTIIMASPLVHKVFDGEDNLFR